MNKIFFGMVFVTGIVLSVISGRIDAASAKCTNANVRNSLRGLVVVSALLIAFSFSYFVCSWNCPGCSTGKMNLTVMSALVLILGVVLTVLGAIMNSASSGDPECQEIKSLTASVIGTGIGMTLISFSYIVYVGNKQYDFGKDLLNRFKKKPSGVILLPDKKSSF